MLNEKNAAFAKTGAATYLDFRNNTVSLADEELAYFYQEVSDVLAATGIDIPVYPCDHEQLPHPQSEALGIHWLSADHDDEFITIDNLFIHEAYEAAFSGAFNMHGETLVSVLCHELAHIHYRRHSKWHADLTARYISMAAKTTH